MAFEIFAKSRHGYSSVRILKAGSITIGKKVVEEYFGGCNYALMLYDKNSRLVGIKPSIDITKGGYKIIRNKYGSVEIKCKSFVLHIGALGISVHTNHYWNPEMEHLEFHLDFVEANLTPI